MKLHQLSNISGAEGGVHHFLFHLQEKGMPRTPTALTATTQGQISLLVPTRLSKTTSEPPETTQATREPKGNSISPYF